jgi:hypothetical protein
MAVSSRVRILTELEDVPETEEIASQKTYTITRESRNDSEPEETTTPGCFSLDSGRVSSILTGLKDGPGRLTSLKIIAANGQNAIFQRTERTDAPS